MKKALISSLFLVALSATSTLGQSTDPSSPMVVDGNSIRSILIDDNPDGYQTYYFAINLNAGRYQANLQVKTKECNGSGVSVYINDDPNVFTSGCDIPTGISTARLDFTVGRSGRQIVKIFATGGDNEKLDVNLTFNGGNGKKATTSPVKTCTYADNFKLSDAQPRYTKTFNGLIFRRGTAQMFITASNQEGTNISGTVYAKQTDAGQYNENMVLPVDGFGGTIGTPLTNHPVREVQQISGSGRGQIDLLFEQNGNSTNKTGRYKLVVKGDAIVDCGTKK